MRSRNTISSLNATARLIRAVCVVDSFSCECQRQGLIAYTASVPIETSRLGYCGHTLLVKVLLLLLFAHTVPRCRAARVIRLETIENSAERRRTVPESRSLSLPLFYRELITLLPRAQVSEIVTRIASREKSRSNLEFIDETFRLERYLPTPPRIGTLRRKNGTRSGSASSRCHVVGNSHRE